MSSFTRPLNSPTKLLAQSVDLQPVMAKAQSKRRANSPGKVKVILNEKQLLD